MKNKKLKVLFYGEEMKHIYPYATKWEVLKYKTMKLIRKIGIWFSILIAVVMIGEIAICLFSKHKEVIIDKEVIVDNLAGKILEIKKEVIDSLRACESGGYSEEDGILIRDSKETISIGTFQFQKKTVIHYYKTLYGKDITGKEAVLIALDDTRSAELAEAIIFGTDGGFKNWLNCSNKIGIKYSVELIKKLQ